MWCITSKMIIYETLMKMRTEKSYAVRNLEETLWCLRKMYPNDISKTQEVNLKE